MSIFDIIKYSVSYPPTHDEMNNLPEDVFKKWKSENGWASTANREITVDYLRTIMNPEMRLQQIKALNQMLKDWNGPL